MTTSSPNSKRLWSVTQRLLTKTRRPRRAPLSRIYMVQIGELRNTGPAKTRTIWLDIEYLTQWNKGQSGRSMRICASQGARQPVSFVAKAERTIKETENKR